MPRVPVLVALLVLARTAAGDPPLPPAAPSPAPAPEPAGKPLTAEKAADAILAAVKAKDDMALSALAAKDDPDPWLVADDLLSRNEHDAASAYARVASRRPVGNLAAYVARNRGSDAVVRSAVAEARGAFRSLRYEEVLDLAPAEITRPATVQGLLAGYVRAMALHALGRLGESSAAYRVVGARAEEVGWLRTAAAAYDEAGSDASERGDYLGALEAWKDRLRVDEARDHKVSAAGALGNLGIAYFRLGDYAQALDLHERSLAAARAMSDERGIATETLNLAAVYGGLQDAARAMDWYTRARDLMEGLRDGPGVAAALVGSGNAHVLGREYSEALTDYARALKIQEAIGDVLGASRTRGNMGVAHASLGDHAAAQSEYLGALGVQAARGDTAAMAQTMANIGVLRHLRGDDRAALSTLEKAVAKAEESRAASSLVFALTSLGRVQLAAGQAGPALLTARRALPHLELLTGRLADEEGASSRLPAQSVFAIGALAAARLGNVEAVAQFVEAGRAGALLEALGGRDAMRASLLPADLSRAEAEARSREAAAQQAYRQAKARGDLQGIRDRLAELDRSQEALRGVIGTIQRSAKKAAAVTYPRPIPLTAIQVALEPGTALVSYFLFADSSLALVVTRDAARCVFLGHPDEIAAACTALRLGDPQGASPSAVGRLQALVVAPLDLASSVREVLVSPAADLSYVPFSLLLPDRVVAHVPSGSTYAHLGEERPVAGRGVLALGDPEAGPTGRLPASADEANAVGDVVLLRGEATEAGLREAVAKRPRWRAVHFACHGHVDVERPLLSGLLLSPSADDDGTLTALDAFRTKIPADLAMLSACETGKGKVIEGEGIVGLTRAFMYAGAPRVICSLWKVDDVATRALMVRFYELWNPKDGSKSVGTAAALKGAQEYVKSQERWKHPYYWAAWVLWGLPD